jgi:hypothetical protein
MYKATVEPMPDNPPDRVLHTGLWRVVIYDDEDNFVRSDKEYISYFEAKKLSENLNSWLSIKSNAASPVHS